MLHEEEIELRIWEFLDGAGDSDTRQATARLISTEARWKSKHEEIMQLQAGLNSLETEQPSMRFSRNVMDAVAAIAPLRATSSYINKWIVGGVGAFFIVVILASLLDVARHAEWEGFSSGSLTKGFQTWSIPSFQISDTVLYFFAAINVIAILI
ncbi:MAG: hypothetical protein EOP49_46980, partial [Sphingobacteriales bacterium]